MEISNTQKRRVYHDLVSCTNIHDQHLITRFILEHLITRHTSVVWKHIQLKNNIIIDNLGITYKTTDDEVYATLDDYIKEGDLKNVQKFLSLTQVSDEVLDGKYLADMEKIW